MLARQIQFMKTDIWRVRSRDLPLMKSIWIRLLRIAIISVRRFDKHNCMFRASALTFYSLLSIVPVLAMVFGIAMTETPS